MADCSRESRQAAPRGNFAVRRQGTETAEIAAGREFFPEILPRRPTHQRFMDEVASENKSP